MKIKIDKKFNAHKFTLELVLPKTGQTGLTQISGCRVGLQVDILGQPQNLLNKYLLFKITYHVIFKKINNLIRLCNVVII